jgi:hypothetical protein
LGRLPSDQGLVIFWSAIAMHRALDEGRPANDAENCLSSIRTTSRERIVARVCPADDGKLRPSARQCE